MFNQLQIRSQANRYDLCELEPTYILLLFVSPHLSSLAAEKIRKLFFISPTSSPGTVALQNCRSSAWRLAVASRM